jgi:hypothetical protein
VIPVTCPSGVETAFCATPLSTTRTKFKLFPYDKKFAAVKKYPAVVSLGVPNCSTSLASDSTDVTLLTGPHAKAPENAPAVVATEGTTVLLSYSVTKTPGES